VAGLVFATNLQLYFMFLQLSGPITAAKGSNFSAFADQYPSNIRAGYVLASTYRVIASVTWNLVILLRNDVVIGQGQATWSREI